MRKIALLLLSSAIASPALAIDASVKDAPVAFDVNFIYHVDAGVAEQDVYIERETGSGEVWRPGPKDNLPNAPLFASAEPQRHMPGNPEADGPYPQGADLKLTLREWLGASGNGQYRCENGQGHLTIDFEGLVPDGVYTLWHFFMVNGATDPFIGTYDLPAGAYDGSQSIFTADASGAAVYDQTYETCLQLSGEQLSAGLAVNWHSDGKTYGVEPGEFGLNAHIQLFAELPTRAGL
ncbi:hypothetical protein [Roseibium sp. MMSF_3544]|uniref:hypothetical protein n=1 Tax=unclassified Roseibium TaxID=2629323 RepID=UPI00273D48AB|nr:hypothetical protein [Roseibium sp. MMSF_3544]